MQKQPDHLFSTNEVIDLSNSIINVHRVLKALSKLIGEIDEPATSNKELSGNAFILWGLRTLAERFLSDQNKNLTRIMEIYKTETDILTQRISEKG